MGKFFNKLKQVALGNGYTEQELPNFDQPGKVVEWFMGGNGDDGNRDMEMLSIVERHGVRITTRQNIGLNSLMLLNQHYNDPVIDEFVENWVYLRAHGKDGSRDIKQAIEYIYNKRFTENINTSMRLQK